MMICNRCDTKHEQPGIDYATTVSTDKLKQRGEIKVNKCRECGSTDLRKGESSMRIQDNI